MVWQKLISVEEDENEIEVMNRKGKKYILHVFDDELPNDEVIKALKVGKEISVDIDFLYDGVKINRYFIKEMK